MATKKSLKQVAEADPVLTEEMLEEGEEEEVQQLSAPRPVVVHEAIRLEGEYELTRTVSGLAWSGLAAGLSMGFSMVAEGLLHYYLPTAEWTPLVSKFGYAVGFLIVILARQQLFTENTVTVILPLLSRRSAHTFWRVARLWIVVLVSNLVGALLFAVVLGRTEVFNPEVKQVFQEIGVAATAGDIWSIGIRAVFAGWLIALMVWMMPAADTSRVWIIIIITYVVGLAQLAHIVAGSVEVLYVVVSGEVSFWDYLGGFMVPTLVGNVIGGVSLVAALNHAQVRAGDEREQN